MSDRQASAAKRLATGIMGLMMLAVVLLAAFFIAVEAGHDCSGEDCPICLCMEQCENTLRNMGDGLASFAVTAFFCFFAVLTAELFSPEITGITLVSQKIRMND